MDQNSARRIREGATLDEAAEAGARRAQRARAVLCAVGARPRPRREFYRLPQTDLGKFRLGPRASRLGLFADLARRRADRAAGRPPVRSLRAAHRLRARAASARRRVPGRGPRANALAVPAQRRPLRRARHRPDRQRAELDPARPLVRPAAADRDGDRLFGDRRRHPGAAAGVAAPDRPDRLARRLPAVRRRRARACCCRSCCCRGGCSPPARRTSSRKPIRDFRRQRLDACERDAPPRLLGAVLHLLLHRGRRCTRSPRRSSPI